MLKYSGNTINDWNYGTSNLIKVYRNNAIVFYKVGGESPTPEYKVCFAVVDDITQYQETEFEDVYDNATEKWYKLNNLNQYEEYGVYASGRTSCEGSTSRLPQGYTEVEYIQNNTQGAYINTGLLLYDVTGNSFSISAKLKSQYESTWAGDGYYLQTIINSEDVSSPYYGFTFRYAYRTHVLEGACNPSNSVVFSSIANTDGTSSLTINCNSTTVTNQVPLELFASYNGNYNTPYRFSNATIYSFQVTKNNTLVRDLVPCKRDSDDKYGLYDLVTDTFYLSPNNVDFVGGDPVTPTDCVTTYNGKLTIDDGYEYEWNGSSWVNVGEVSGSSRLPQGYTEVEYITAENLASGITGPYIDTNFTPNQNTRVVLDYQAIVNGQNNRRIFGSGRFNNRSSGNYIWSMENRIGQSNCYYYYKFDNGSGWKTTSLHPDLNRHVVDFNKEGKIWLDDTAVVTLPSNTVNCSYHLGIFNEINSGAETVYEYFQGRVYSCQVYDNGTLVRDLVPCTNSSNVVGMYDIVGNTFYSSARQSYQFDAGSSVAPPIVYPIAYDEKSDPLNDLTFNTLAEAQAYAYNNCVYDGMKATIDGDRYYFDSEDENGWVKILEYYKVEDVTPSGGSGWTISGSSRYNPDSTYYDDFDLETTSTSNVTKIAKVTIYGYDHFTYYLRSYHGYSGAHGYVMSTNVDEIQTPPASMSYDSSSAITTTYYWNKSPKSDVNLSNYRRVTYNNLDKTVEHTFYVYFYGRTYSSYVGNATILIPKEQTNENWEQVTFSSSTNVSRTTKSLYIDGNYSNSGGTQYWYYRWIVGLPSGSHSSSVSYNSYNYCPNVTSSTFTSVAGEQRQVNFTYDGTVDKNLSFRLTDGSNVLIPSDTVYYNIAVYNSCGVSSSSSNVTFPRSLSVKVGGSFSFSNSSNRHYIYGYQPPTLGTRYYVDNYQSTFDIVYTKLSEEAVTIAYTAYDPNDSEIPAFNTDITYPYNGGTTSSTTLTSFDVPYTYPYEVSQTNDKFSADSQSYTANQAARTISFVLYPDNREFATVADMEAYQYAWEGMKATVGDTKYKYKNGEWVENQHSLPDVPFTVNYNAKQYNASTKTLLKTEGQLADVDAVITAGTPTVNDGYLTIASSTRATISGYQNYFNRDNNNNPNLTIISKQRTDGGNCHMFANRDSNYNWMYRPTSAKLCFHGTRQIDGTNTTTQPVIESVRVNSNKLLTFNNYTDNTSSTYSNFAYGSTNSGKFAIFAGYGTNSGEWFVGDFYWVYMSQNTLTDEQIQQVIDYNENL